jgi:hypothetical protein
MDEAHAVGSATNQTLSLVVQMIAYLNSTPSSAPADPAAWPTRASRLGWSSRSVWWQPGVSLDWRPTGSAPRVGGKHESI